MAVGDAYVTLAEFKARIKLTDALDDTEITEILLSVSREIEQHCKRQFNKETTATARLFGRDRILQGVAWVDDLHTTTGLIIATDDGNDGTYSTVWSTSDYELQPLNGIVDGESGWPFYRIHPIGGKRIPGWVDRAPLKVTAQWGWNAVPKPVKQACQILAQETLKIVEAPFGVAGFGEFGAVRVRDNPFAIRKLKPYVRKKVLVA